MQVTKVSQRIVELEAFLRRIAADEHLPQWLRNEAKELLNDKSADEFSQDHTQE